MAGFVYHVYFVLLFLIIGTVTQDNISVGGDRTEQHPARDFSRHTLIKPRIYHGREKRQISTTKEDENRHVDHITVAFPIDGEEFILDLTLNKQLIPKGYFTKTQVDGKHQVVKPTAEEVELCHYSGKVRGKSESWVALSTCDGLSGVIFDGDEMHYVEKDPKNPGSDYKEIEHFLYKHSDIHQQHNKTCGFGGDAIHRDHVHTDNRILRYKRAAEQNELVRGPYNANRESKYVELVLVVDNREYKELGESTSRVEQHCKSIANIINGLYAPLNIFIALVGVVIWTETDEISFSENGDTTLTNFLHYRREKLVKEHPNDNAQLLTKFNFENGVVGKALKGPICTYEYSGGVNNDHSAVVGLVATTVAHEMGHNFGMEHDTNECQCPEDRCIMAPSSSTVAPTHWSSCSLNYLLLAFTHGMDYCLKNKPTALFDSPVCGNGFVEPGEQCDCGLPEHCDNTCCNALTCMLHSNASCATGSCCDLNTCKPKSAGTLCRSADYECDLPEYCTGQSEYCPADIHKMDTEICDNGKAFCYHGFCRTRTDQCKLLWGETGKSSDEQCYKMNVKGTRHGNCGYNKFNQSFFKCTDENVLCGMLHCKHLSERLEFGMESVSILSHSFINLKGLIVPCRTAIVDLGINQVDPGLSPDGAKCGEGKMCVNQRCMSVSNLQRQGPACPHDCNGNGWCNNLGHCHCKDGFAPPFCEDPGPGGSEDSGPASDPSAHQRFVAALFITFLGVIPMLLILAFLTYYFRFNITKGRLMKSPPPTSKSPTKPRAAPFSSETARRTEDNHSLLRQEEPPVTIENQFFGHFKGFTLTPMKNKEPEPARSAPPPPVVAPSAGWNIPVKSPQVLRSNTTAPPTAKISKSVSRVQSFKDAISNINTTSAAPALPPPNPGSHAKPIISSPILENSTCTAKELISPLKHVPKAVPVPVRAAPEAPPKTEPPKERPLSTSEVVIEEPKKKETGPSTLNRIASFLKQDKKFANTNSLPRVPKKTLDKNALRSIEISNPIPQADTVNMKTLPVNTEESKAVIMRAQSMRSPNHVKRPVIHTFGSMRQPNVKRPVSIPSGSRPKSPPPPRPTDLPDASKIKIPTLPGYQKPSNKPVVVVPPPASQNQYDDCLNTAPLARGELSPTGSDNIYAVIEETPTPTTTSGKTTTSSNSNESMGLLGEIVSEIQNRNFDSIYSTSTLARKKKEQEQNGGKSDDTYENTAAIYKSPTESVYSNMNTASSTSSGYIHPSAVNVPIKAPEPPKEEPKPMSTFKSEGYKPFASTFTRPPGPLASSFKANQNQSKSPKSPPSPKAPLSPKESPKTSPKRQNTPPNLRTRKPSPSRQAPPVTAASASKTRSITNSPDLVTSCNNTKPKPPDVTNVKKPAISNKPSVNGLPKGPPKITNQRAVSVKVPTVKPQPTKLNKANSDAGGKTTPTSNTSVARQNSNVASLQQKFENKAPTASKVVPKTKA